ncbi:g188 [Coccomyxa elongata]
MKPQRQTRSSQHTSHGEILLKGRSLSLIAQPLACVSRQAPKRRASTAAQAGAQWRGGGLKAAPTCEAALLHTGWSERYGRAPWPQRVAAVGQRPQHLLKPIVAVRLATPNTAAAARAACGAT